MSMVLGFYEVVTIDALKFGVRVLDRLLANC
jgi:hypothetical protein